MFSDAVEQDIVLDAPSAWAWHAQQNAASLIPFWVIQSFLPQYPAQFVARAWTAVTCPDSGHVAPTPYFGVILAATLRELRGMLPAGLLCIPRAASDDPTVVERWMS